MDCLSVQAPCPLCSSYRTNLYRSILRSYADQQYTLELRRCSKCEFVFLANNPNIEYDEDYLYREGVVTVDSLVSQFRAEERISSIAKSVLADSRNRFFDIGIGDGCLLSIAEGAGYDTYGLDVNSATATLARQIYNLRSQLHIGSFETAFPDKTFDVIHMNEVIEHIGMPMPLLHWCRKKLNHNGLLVIQTGNVESLVSRIKGKRWDYFRPVHVSYFSTKSLRFALECAGFQVVSISIIDWRLSSSMQVTKAIIKEHGVRKAVAFLSLFLTALPYGIRRSMIFHAK